MISENPSTSTRTNTSKQNNSFDGISSSNFDKSEANARSDFVKKGQKRKLKWHPNNMIASDYNEFMNNITNDLTTFLNTGEPTTT